MGGFRINGCGVTEHYKKLKSLGVRQCPICGRESEFFLDRIKLKIDIFFIPTLTLKTSYAVMCSACEQGRKCSKQWAGNLMNSAGPVPVIFEVQAPIPLTVPEEPAPAAPESAAPEQAPQQPLPKGNALPSFFKCPHCGVTQLREGPYCSYCGEPAPGEPNEQSAAQPADVPGAGIVCPACGSMQEPGVKFCASCGHPTQEQPSPARVCPGCGAKIEAGAAFCMECGMKL